MDTFLSNAAGKRISPAEEFRLPELASGQIKDMVADTTDYTLTVVAGGRYWVQAIGTGVTSLGIADATGAANVLWTIPPNQQIGIEIPIGYTTLHMSTTAAGDDVCISRANI